MISKHLDAFISKPAAAALCRFTAAAREQVKLGVLAVNLICHPVEAYSALDSHLPRKGAGEGPWPFLGVARRPRISAFGGPAAGGAALIIKVAVLPAHLLADEALAGRPARYRRRHTASPFGPHRRILLSTACACY